MNQLQCLHATVINPSHQRSCSTKEKSNIYNQWPLPSYLQSLIQPDDIGVAKLGQNPGLPVQILPTIFIFDLTGINYLNCNLWNKRTQWFHSNMVRCMCSDNFTVLPDTDVLWKTNVVDKYLSMAGNFRCAVTSYLWQGVVDLIKNCRGFNVSEVSLYFLTNLSWYSQWFVWFSRDMKLVKISKYRWGAFSVYEVAFGYDSTSIHFTCKSMYMNSWYGIP